VAGTGGLSEIQLLAFSGFFSNRVLTSVRPKDSAALGTLSESLRTLGLTHISGVGVSTTPARPASNSRFGFIAIR
jgi:hypothetical protein